MAFLIDSLKEKIGNGKDEDGFDDMNYIVGNTSGMDIGQVPSPIDQRIGRMSQIGGAIMELQITNPTTFQIDRREILNVISQLGLDVTLHGDPNIGFTSAYATGGREAGFNIVHRYMKRYLEQMAAFKYEVDQREDLDFNVGYVNMHASNEQIPAREERLAQDVSVDPFGEQIREPETGKEFNIYRNEEFMEKMFDFFFLDVVQNPWQLYRQEFSNQSPEFKEAWDDAQEEACNTFYDQELAEADNEAEKATALVQTGARYDQGLETYFLGLCEEQKLGISIRVPETDRMGQRTGETTTIELETLADLRQFNLFDQIGAISRDLSFIRRETFTGRQDQQMTEEIQETISSNYDKIAKAARNVAEELWDEYLSVQSKISALSNNADIEQTQIFQEAEGHAEDAAKEAFAREDWDQRKKLLEKLFRGRRLSDDMNKESNIFFKTMPAWMMHASESYENHPGWEAPEYIWDTIVGDRFESFEEMQEYLDEDRENELEVIAAVGCVYIWGHWTQVRNRFDYQAFEGMGGGVEVPEPEEAVMPWTRWMNMFGLKLNIEAMYGDPGQLRRVWRPKDIAVACRAINMTARKQSEGWGEEFRGPVAKFTIDMEHTASYGVDPYQEILRLIKQEKDAASESGADPKKPLADIVKTYHLTKPGWEQQQGHRHGPFARGDETLYGWLYKMIENGFARNPDDQAVVMFEVGGEYREEMYVIRVAMDMIERGIKPEELDPTVIPIDEDYETVEQALMARFFGLDKNQFNAEMAKIEEHAFDPLDGLLETEGFDYTFSSSYAVNQAGNRPNEWMNEEYK